MASKVPVRTEWAEKASLFLIVIAPLIWKFWDLTGPISIYFLVALAGYFSWWKLLAILGKPQPKIFSHGLNGFNGLGALKGRLFAPNPLNPWLKLCQKN